MPTIDHVLDINKKKYDKAYGAKRVFLEYPADWIIRFWSLFLRREIPSGRVLDYGCGSANNARFFADKGYEVHGTEVTQEVLPLIEKNMGSAANFHILDPEDISLPYPDGFFDVAIANQVFNYCGNTQRIRAVADEIKRTLRPGGVLFLTTIGPKNVMISKFGKRLEDHVYEVTIGEGHRLAGYHEFSYVVNDEEHLRSLFDMFEPLTVGYFDQSMFDLESNFHWIFAGRKAD